MRTDIFMKLCLALGVIFLVLGFGFTGTPIEAYALTVLTDEEAQAIAEQYGYGSWREYIAAEGTPVDYSIPDGQTFTAPTEVDYCISWLAEIAISGYITADEYIAICENLQAEKVTPEQVYEDPLSGVLVSTSDQMVCSNWLLKEYNEGRLAYGEYMVLHNNINALTIEATDVYADAKGLVQILIEADRKYYEEFGTCPGGTNEYFDIYSGESIAVSEDISREDLGIMNDELVTESVSVNRIDSSIYHKFDLSVRKIGDMYLPFIKMYTK